MTLSLPKGQGTPSGVEACLLRPTSAFCEMSLGHEKLEGPISIARCADHFN